MTQASTFHNLTGLVDQAPVPGIAVAVFDASGVTFTATTGLARIDTSEAVTMAHRWDLASLTKVLVTLPEILALVEAGRLALDEILADQWPASASSAIGTATLRQILAYNAGLPASVPFFRSCTDKPSVLAAALAAPATHPAGSGAVYSDLGAMVLGAVVDDLVGPLDELARRRTGLRFGPVPDPVVATERCPWRGRMLQGEVHDENAWAMGGIAGHAGAFGTLDEVVAAVQAWMRFTTVEGSVWAESVQPQSMDDRGRRFGLGWWLTRWDLGPGTRPGGMSWGCPGFVGNRIWVRPDLGLGVVVLSNQVHPERSERESFWRWCDELLVAVATAHAGSRGQTAHCHADGGL